MKFFTNRNSILAGLLTWFVALASFADGANLTDLVSGVTTLHFDECSSLSSEESAGSLAIPGTAQAKTDFSRPSLPIRHVILDQDSPSLAATPQPTSEALAFIPIEEPLAVPRVFYTQLLYLQHCTFLL